MMGSCLEELQGRSHAKAHDPRCIIQAAYIFRANSLRCIHHAPSVRHTVSGMPS